MRQRRVLLGRARFILWTLLGVLSFAAFPYIERYEVARFKAAEPFYASPVAVIAGGVAIRNDNNAQGRFGVSRGGGKRRHEGLDLISAPDSPVFAAHSGRASYVGVNGGYGNFIRILHPDGYSTGYAHLNAVAVSWGEWVEQGMVIGTSGKTGNADSDDILPHLHFEIRRPDRKALDPLKGYLDPKLAVR